MARHNWDKIIYHGKFSSFERRAVCVICGCVREKILYGWKYILNGIVTYEAPNCLKGESK